MGLFGSMLLKQPTQVRKAHVGGKGLERGKEYRFKDPVPLLDLIHFPSPPFLCQESLCHMEQLLPALMAGAPVPTILPTSTP